jgi:hypothetical protein
MNPIDSSLQRLFRAAAQVRENPPCEAPFQVEAHVLAGWRRQSAQEADDGLGPVLRAAFICACVILAISAALTFGLSPETPPNEMVILDSAMQLTLIQ